MNKLQVGIVVVLAVVVIGGGTAVVGAQAPGEPANLYGHVSDQNGVPAPAGTTIVAVVDGNVEGEISIDTAGVYGTESAFGEKLSLDSAAGDKVHFHLHNASGPEAINSPYDLNAGTDEHNLTFQAGSFNTVGAYADENGVVQTDGLLMAIGDWRADEISTDLLLTVIDAWRAGDPVSASGHGGNEDTTDTTVSSETSGSNWTEDVELQPEGDASAAAQVATLTANQTVNGVIVDQQEVQITATGVADEDGIPLSETEVTIAIVQEGTTLLTTNAEVTEGELKTTLDTTTIGPDDETGRAEIVIVGSEDELQREIRLVHEAYSIGEGFTQWSVPQPATLYGEQIEAVTQWNPTDETYISGIEDRRIHAAVDLHRGLYIDGVDETARIGVVFDTAGLQTPGQVELGEGWHLASTNFAIEQDPTRTISEDLISLDVESDSITVLNETRGTVLSSASAVEAYDTYWIKISDSETHMRPIITPIYDPSDRAETTEGSN